MHDTISPVRFIFNHFSSNKYLTISLVLLILFAVYLCFYQLGKSPLDNWDEAWYAEITKNMLKSHNFIIPMWNGEHFFEKPPLYMWLTSFFSLFFGLSEFSVRLTSAISGIILISVVLLFSYKKFGFVPSAAAFATLAFNSVFIARVRSGNLDSLTALFVFLIFLLTLVKSRKRFLFLGICFGLLALTKGSFVLFPLAIFILHEFVFRRKTFFKDKLHYLLLFSLTIIIPGIWLGFGYFFAGALGSLFLISYISNSDQGASRLSLETFKWDYFTYTYYAMQRRYTYVLVLGVALLLRKVKEPFYFLLLFFPLSLLLVLSFGEKTNNWYLVPIMPFFSIIIAYAVYWIIILCKNNIFVKVIILAALFALSFRAYMTNITPILETRSAVGEADSGKYVDKHAYDYEAVTRLDQLYPSMVYYSNRKIYSSIAGFKTQGIWLSRDDLKQRIRDKQMRWVVGTKSEVASFVKEFPDYPVEIIQINEQETIARMYK